MGAFCSGGKEDVTRVEIFMSLIRLLEQTMMASAFDSNSVMVKQHFTKLPLYQQLAMPVASSEAASCPVCFFFEFRYVKSQPLALLAMTNIHLGFLHCTP